MDIPPVVAVLGQTLALFGGLGGSIAGAVAGYMHPRRMQFWRAFLVYLGILCAIASTWAGSLEIVPLALFLGATAGVLPFAAAFFISRRLVALLRNWLQSRSSASS